MKYLLAGLIPVLFSACRAAAPSAKVLRLSDAPVKRHAKGAEVRFLQAEDEAFVAHLTLPAGGKVPEHRDETAEYLFVLRGSGTVWIEDSSYPVEEKTFIYMPPNAKVRFENGGEDLEVVQLFIPSGPEKKYASWK